MPRPFRLLTPLLVVLLAGVSVTALAWAYRRLPAIAAQNRSEGDVITQSMVREKTVPPIDAAAPAETETATFAMG